MYLQTHDSAIRRYHDGAESGSRSRFDPSSYKSPPHFQDSIFTPVARGDQVLAHIQPRRVNAVTTGPIRRIDLDLSSPSVDEYHEAERAA